MPVSDKKLHFAGYFILTALFILAQQRCGVPTWRRLIATPAILAAYGAFDETTQQLVNRNAAFGDWAADVLGVIAAVVIVETALSLLARREAAGSGNSK